MEESYNLLSRPEKREIKVALAPRTNRPRVAPAKAYEGDAVAAEQEHTPDQSHPECYYREYLRLAADQDSMRATLYEVYNERQDRGWKLISATKDPDGDWLLMEWDTSGDFSE